MAAELLKDKRIPYICAPLIGKDKDEVLAEVNTIISKTPDIIEWRADFLARLNDYDYVLSIIKEIKALTDIPILFTIRAEWEGGEKSSLSEEERIQLLAEVCQNVPVDIVDVEVCSNPQDIKQLREVSSKHGVKLILSYHNFQETPSKTELKKCMAKAEGFDADVVKVAVMPENKADVFRLLEVTREAEEIMDKPLISISMGELGSLSRIMGWAYGSILTFGVGVESSAPGQLQIEKLRELIQSLQEAANAWK